MKLNNATPAAPAAPSPQFDVYKWARTTMAKIEAHDYVRKLREKNKRLARQKKKNCNQLNLF